MKKKIRFNRPNKAIINIVLIKILCAIIVLANILYTMTFKVHLRSGVSVLNYAYGLETAKEIKAERGKILDRNGEIIAQDVDTYTMVAYLDKNRVGVNNTPAHVVDVKDTAEKLSKITDLSTEELLKYLEAAQANNQYLTYFGNKGKNLTSAQKEAIEALELPGIEFDPSLDRNYPIGKFASHLIGYAKYDEEKKTIVGEMGAEALLNEYLAGENGEERYQSTANNTALPGTKHITKKVKNGYNVYLTLDKGVQIGLEKLLQKTMEEFKAQKAWGLVMEVETGKILGWGSYPTFDLNEKDIKDWVNIPSMYPYEPGSVMKGITYASAIDSGVYPENQSYKSGTFYIGIDKNGKAYRSDKFTEEYGKIQEAEGKDHGIISFDNGFKVSSNIAICELLTKYLSPEKFETYLDRFGFFKPVQIPYVQEVVGHKTFQYPIEKLTTGFGQGSSVTAIQMAQAYTALLNDGKMMQPYYVEKIVDPITQEVIQEYLPTVKSQPITKETANKMLDLLNLVMNEPGGTGYNRYRMDDVRIIGKTGTGEVSVDGSYSKSKYISSVMAAAPYKDPKVMMYWVFESSNYKTFTGDPFKEAFRQGLIATGVAGEHVEQENKNPLNKEIYMPQVENHSVTYAKDKLKASGAEVIVIGDGNSVISQFPKANTMVMSNNKIFLLTDGSKILMPDFKGWTRKDALTFANLAKIPVTFEGFGIIQQQNLPKNKPIEVGKELHLILK